MRIKILNKYEQTNQEPYAQFKLTIFNEKSCLIYFRRCVVDWFDCTHVFPTITRVYFVNIQCSIPRDVDSLSSNLSESFIVHTTNPIPFSVFLVTSSWRAKWPINDVKCPVSPNHVLQRGTGHSNVFVDCRLRRGLAVIECHYKGNRWFEILRLALN